jgi:hypothetical protein
MEVSTGKWMARVRTLGSDLLPFRAAKLETIRLHKRRDEAPLDWIRIVLNLRFAGEIARAAVTSEKRKTPVDLMAGRRPGHIDPKIRVIVLDPEIGFLADARRETIKGDDYPIEYHSDGYPKLPACLDRRRPRLRQVA